MRDLNIDPALLLETPERSQLRHLLRDFFAETSSPEDIRKHVESARGHDEVQWRRLAAEIGVQCLVVPEEYGGAGYSFTELAVVLGEAGRALCCAPLLPTLALAVQALLLSGDDDARARYLPGIAEGETTATVAGFGDETEVVAEPARAGWILRGGADFVLDGHGADLVLVHARSPEGPRLLLWEAGTGGCTRTPRQVLDPTRRQARLEFTGAAATPVGEAGDRALDVMRRVLDIGRVALAVEQEGGCGHALDATVSYALQRKQFGRAIGSFQAVKHRLADLLVEVEAARSAAAYATACVTSASSDLPVAASTAKAVCSQAFRRAAAEYVQLHGGIGFTWEHPAHLYLRRARSSEVMLGTADDHLGRLADLLELQ
ncbi:acyl-CoA dehydrogenase [Saccharopolyspora erythraea NRRL 2338]|uniref:Acyl-CoA dehydrogenase-like n=2 Tax=Saccharopolyspora erythraea TaxID=1836 RepID=A4FDB4_SACEN|nr:acyl-CoA dehydrogenase family protein [Saccharopolyspora erythraea]EQD81552.1 acyl-CoA dehydrogenase [Saccharopolyspora erythraea D]PFG95782.1 acyl-CoA dehydrogenase [Saccharopolyspora erythraea NRRL 2338]QRK92369.1 acyl-CoA/acyl-ACP dehydrogenase [Saccharopolyspora erythraea]CAM02039.1 acyl-CoA dehydrogenase-like [Saccharopolyspora erythraea NRRL 2338]